MEKRVGTIWSRVVEILVFLFPFTGNYVVGIDPIWFSCPNLKAIRNH